MNPTHDEPELPPDEIEEFSELDRYVDAWHRGAAPDRERMLAEHPEWASALDCLDALARLGPAVEGAAKDAVRGSSDPAPTTPLAGHKSTADDSGVGFLPREFGEYELVEVLGRGGMGVVFKARQRSLDRLVAIKMIAAGHFVSREQLVRFRNEAQAAAALQHANIVHVYEAGQHGGQHYFAMQFVEGPSLASVAARRTLDIESSARLMVKIARAVEHLHRHGIVHRDLKPSNILLDADGEPYVSDFGLVKVFRTDEQLTQSGIIAGTPSYMSPEQAAGRPAETDARSDVYSLGVILYELLCGRPPFREQTPLDTLVQVIEREPPAPRSWNRAIRRSLEAIVLKCLEKSPKRRYRTAAELADDLERWLRRDPVAARPPGLGSRLVRWTQRSPALASRLAVLTIFAVIEWLNYSLFKVVPADFHYRVTAIMAVWVAASVALNRLMWIERWATTVKFVWGAVDIVLYTLIMWQSDRYASPLIVGYPLLIVGSGLWFRVRLVWFMTALSLVSYGLLVADFYLLRPDLHQRFDTAYDRPVFFAVMLLAMGTVVAYQINRVRALSRYYESRREP